MHAPSYMLYVQTLERQAVQVGKDQDMEYVVVHPISGNGNVRATVVRVEDQHVCYFGSPEELNTACEQGR